VGLCIKECPDPSVSIFTVRPTIYQGGDMEQDHRVLLGKILGEIYRLQRGNEDVSCPASDSHIFALLNGFEGAINEELNRIGFVTEAEVRAVMDVLEPIWLDKEKLDAFKGFYDIEHKLEAVGVGRSKAIGILKFLHANQQFTDVIKKMDTSGSPIECRTFELDEWDV
jgi:hypothetical protein